MIADTGGPAFPQPPYVSQNNATGETVHHQWTSDGMTLRDYFAAKAMQAYFTDPEVGFSAVTLEAGARNAYRIAGAMLVARRQESSV